MLRQNGCNRTGINLVVQSWSNYTTLSYCFAGVITTELLLKRWRTFRITLLVQMTCAPVMTKEIGRRHCPLGVRHWLCGRVGWFLQRSDRIMRHTETLPTQRTGDILWISGTDFHFYTLLKRALLPLRQRGWDELILAISVGLSREWWDGKYNFTQYKDIRYKTRNSETLCWTSRRRYHFWGKSNMLRLIVRWTHLVGRSDWFIACSVGIMIHGHFQHFTWKR